MSKPATYIDSQHGLDLLPSRTRLLFAAYLDHGLGFTEKVEYRVGPSACGRFNVLWQSGDWDEERPILQAVAWLPRHQLSGKVLHVALLRALFIAEKSQEETRKPNFDEVIGANRALLSSKEVNKISAEVFGD